MKGMFLIIITILQGLKQLRNKPNDTPGTRSFLINVFDSVNKHLLI